MPKRVPTIGVTVVRDGKRVTPEPGKAFDFTADEIASVTAVHPSAFRKPVNESAEQPVDDETTPGKEGDKSANVVPKPAGKRAKQAAAQADSTSKKATGDAKPSTGSDDASSTDAADGGDTGGDEAGEDDDI